MSLAWTALVASIIYLVILFLIAIYGDRRADMGRSVIDSPYIYTLSIAVYCTAWTYYGSVGLAAGRGIAFLPVYLGPTLMALLFPFVLARILTIAKAHGITSIADFASARYGKSGLLAGLVTIVAVIGTIPYISLQLKAMAVSVSLLLAQGGGTDVAPTVGTDTALLVTLGLVIFAIFFGTRHIDATEHHQGMVLAVAFEGVVKLVCFLAIGMFVTWALFDGPLDLADAAGRAGYLERLTFEATGYNYADWFLLTLLSSFAFLFLPRQFQVGVIENLRASHLKRATWLLPLYLLLINLFVLPIALAGLVLGLPASEGDSFVLSLPLRHGQEALTLMAYLGGFSAATAMIIVETIALSTMISNDLVIPVLLRIKPLRLNERTDLTGLVLLIRRSGILIILLLGYLFFRTVGEKLGLVSIGWIAFAAVAQFAPPIIIGIYWKEANLYGAVAGLLGGFAVWLYTLVVPAFVNVDALAAGLPAAQAQGVELFRPMALFGLIGLHPVSHATLWSLSVNTILLVGFSLLMRQNTLERLQAILFVEVEQSRDRMQLWRGEVRVGALLDLLVRFLGPQRAEAVMRADAEGRVRALHRDEPADAALVHHTERQLARAIGTASARAVVASVARGEIIGSDALMEILDETQKVMAYSRRLEEKSRELEAATAELRLANERLLELDRMKDDFLATVSHELRTPLTSIRSFSEILLDTPDLDEEERRHFLSIVIRESERLTRLINDVLDLSKIESGRMEWQVGASDLAKIIREAVNATEGIIAEKRVKLDLVLPKTETPVISDHDRLVQVVINLLSNACKFVPADAPRVRVELRLSGDSYEVRIEDNGPGVPVEWRETVFEKFRQVTDNVNRSKPKGTGLGLTICRQIVEHFGGRIWVDDASIGGAAVCFTLPIPAAEPEIARAAE